MSEQSVFEITLKSYGINTDFQDFNKFVNRCIEIQNVAFKQLKQDLEKQYSNTSINWKSIMANYIGLTPTEVLDKVVEANRITEKDLENFINKEEDYKIRSYVYSLMFCHLLKHFILNNKKFMDSKINLVPKKEKKRWKVIQILVYWNLNLLKKF